jgi:hypothetical protein
MTQEERRNAIKVYQKENNQKVLKALKLPAILILLGLGYIYIVDGVFEFQSKWASLPGATLIILALYGLQEIIKDWNKIPEFDDDPLLDSRYDKLITFFSGFFLLVPFFTLIILTIWTQNFYSQWRFWGFSLGFGIFFSTSLYNILKNRIPGFEQHNKQRLEELGRLWVLFLLVGMLIFQGLLFVFPYFETGKIVVVKQKKDVNEIFYEGSWTSARYTKNMNSLLINRDSIQVEVVPIVFGIKYFTNFDTIK